MTRILLALLTALITLAPAQAKRPPNIIVILADDLGYGDLGAYGQTRIRTPQIDAMARQGVRLTDYYAAANLCTPSRAALLTGRYPIRTKLGNEVIQVWDTNGLPLSEVTIADALKGGGYTTGIVGKWHLGHKGPFFPPRAQGFDSYFGIPYSNDMKPLALYSDPQAGGGMVKDDKVDLSTLTRQFTDHAVSFVDANKDKPFFLYLAYSAPHMPERPGAAFKGSSKAHAYGDVVQELDAGVGEVLAALKRNGLDRNTLVIMTSDNGPWFEGDGGGLHDRKGGEGFDGGYRVPFIARMPGVIPAGQTRNAIAMGIDIFPTALGLAGVPLPDGITIDGRDIMPMLTHGGSGPHDHLLFFNNEDIAAVRTQRWKLVARAQYRTVDIPLEMMGYESLFDMADDPQERFAANQDQPAIFAALHKILEQERAVFEPLRTRPAKTLTMPH
jgi:uncharacterized sulfatase